VPQDAGGAKIAAAKCLFTATTQDIDNEVTSSRHDNRRCRSNRLPTRFSDCLGPNAWRRSTLQLLEIPPALPALHGVVMELDDCAFSTLAGVVATDDPNEAFKDSDYALLVGARPRGPGMERKDLLEANAAIFSVQGKAMNDHASKDVRVLVVGNPANTNALIAQSNAPDLNPRNFTAMTRLDHNRACAQLAAKTGKHVDDVRRMTIWGNHSATQYPDIHHATVGGEPALDQVDQAWLADEFIPVVQIGSAWAYLLMAATALSPASFIPTRSVAVVATTRSFRIWRFLTSAANVWTRPGSNCAKKEQRSRNCSNVSGDMAGLAPR